MELNEMDLKFTVMRIPYKLKKIMTDSEWANKIYVGGGFIRSIVSGEDINDIDIFVGDKARAELLATKLADSQKIYKSINAYTIRDGEDTYQIIHRWLFNSVKEVTHSFDFTICCSAVGYDGEWFSFCDEMFYQDLAAKRLVYRRPDRNEDAGGSMLRVLKYYQKGYRMPLDSLSFVIARLMSGTYHLSGVTEDSISDEVRKLLFAVDPQVDPLHEAHLPDTRRL